MCFVGDGERDSLPLELVAPLGPNSPVDNVLAKNLGAYHACYEVDDIEKALLGSASRDARLREQARFRRGLRQ